MQKDTPRRFQTYGNYMIQGQVTEMEAYRNVEINLVVLRVALSNFGSLEFACAVHQRMHMHRTRSDVVGFQHLARDHK